MLGGVINPDYQWEIGLLLYNGAKKDYVWSAGDHFIGYLLVLPYLVIKVNGELQQSNPSRMTNSTDQTRVGVTPPKRAKTCFKCLLTIEEIQNR